jgi:aminomethyltransferase
VNDAERRTALYAEHEALGARFVPYAGWRMPVQYRGVAEEHHAVRSGVGLFDVSHMGRLEFSGPQAVAVIDGAITNDLGRLAPGRALYTCCCNEQGGILDDLIVYRIRDQAESEERVLVVCNAANRTRIAEHLAALARGRCNYEDASDRTCLIAVQGPAALELIATLGSSLRLPDDLPSFHYRRGDIFGLHCAVARTGYTGEDGVEVFCPVEHAPTLWRGLLEAGQRLGVQAIGLAARDTLRLEARLSLYGNEIDLNTNPLEAGLGWTVKTEGREFIGKAAIVRIKEQGLTRRLIGFEMLGRGIARHGYALSSPNGQALGHCTSGAPSPTLGVNIGLGYVPLAYAALGTEIVVDCRGRAVPARIVKTPFYRRGAENVERT